ncbi:MAG: Gfo/Idh/MocA family oxidoreductase [Candidatus Hadarchaeales archaeon]
MKDLKILVVGCGSIGERHIKNLLSLGIKKLSAYDSDAKRLKYVGEKYGVEIEKNLESALAKKPDGALICTPPVNHVPLARQALHAGANVFIEKPLSHSMDGVDEIIEEAEKKGLIISVGYNFRFHPGMRLVKKIIESGEIGKVMFGRAQAEQYLPDWRPWQDYRKSYTARKEMGGGIILDGSHEIDYMRWLLGNVNEVFCFAGKLSPLEINVEDTASILMKHEKNKLSNVHIDFVRRDYSRMCEIVGEEGTVVWSFPAGSVRVFLAKNKKWRNVYRGCDWNRMYVEEMRHFIKCLEGKDRPEVNGEEGKMTLEIALAAKLSAKTGRVVRV